MGKNRHSKDKLYIVANEYQRDWGGCKKPVLSRLPFRCLPFNCCALSLLPFTVPVATADGIVFDADNVTKYIKQYKRHPVTGLPLALKDLIVLHFHKNNEGKYHCPITYKEFNEHSYIVANRISGHVYSHDAIDSLCRKPKNWIDFFTEEKFCSADLITIQNPHDLRSRQIEEFDFVRRANEIPTPARIPAEEGSFEPSMRKDVLALSILAQSKQTEQQEKDQHNKLIYNIHHHSKAAAAADVTTAETVGTAAVTVGTEGKEDDRTNSVVAVTGGEAKKPMKHSIYSTGEQSSSFTSTAVGISYNSEFRSLTDREIRLITYKDVKKKKLNGYVRLTTTLGDLNVELYCDKAPETCDSFIRHCESGFYNNTIFHRSIKSFMIQGGDPTGTGTGGKSGFETGAAFADEFHPILVHKGRGVLSMANTGRNTNRSQFFITYKSCEHLNNKHAVFGKLVGGFGTLDKMENLETVESTDRPVNPPVILAATVFKNPFTDVAREREEQKRKAIEDEARKVIFDKTTEDLLDPMKTHKKRTACDAGKYIDIKKLKRSLAAVDAAAAHTTAAAAGLSDVNDGGGNDKDNKSDNGNIGSRSAGSAVSIVDTVNSQRTTADKLQMSNAAISSSHLLKRKQAECKQQAFSCW